LYTDTEIQELEHLYELRDIETAKTNLLDFTKYTMPTFEPASFHEVYYKVLDLFAQGIIKNLMVTMPPQHGKSEGSTRRLPAYLLGMNPDRKIAVGSYNASFARKFNRDIQRIIDNKEYNKLFPETILNQSNVVTVSDSWLRNSDEFEIVNHRGGLKAVGRGGALTGSPVDVMVMDDLYKDYEEGNSPIIRDSVWNWYTTVVKTRLHNDSQQLIVFTRWHEDDLIGRLEKKENVIEITCLDNIKDIKSNDWVKINFEAIMTQEQTKIDPRKKDTPLWPSKHSLSKLKDSRALSPEQFNCLYQGNPISMEGLLYSPFQTYNTPPIFHETKNYTDTADTGVDFLCSICYGVNNGNFYITDVLYTDESMEVTEVALPKMIIDNGTKKADIESNNGGRGFARVVQGKVRGLCSIGWFHQSQNKEARIVTNSNLVTQHIFMPDGWEKRWPTFYNQLTYFKKVFRSNKQDGIPDVLTGIIEKNHQTRRRTM
jgi:predicted phage terminase large subunit-like protein